MLDKLPTELLAILGFYLHPADIVSISGVCQRLYNWSRDRALWMTSLTRYARLEPGHVENVELLRDVTDLPKFYTRVIERYSEYCGLYRNCRNDSLLIVSMDMALLGIKGVRVPYKLTDNGCIGKSLLFIAPIDTEDCSVDQHQVEYMDNDYNQSIVSIQLENDRIRLINDNSIGRRIRSSISRSPPNFNWIRFDRVMMCQFPVIKSGFFACRILERIMLLQSDAKGIFICSPDAASAHFKVSTNKALDYGAMFRSLMFSDNPNGRMSRDMLESISYDNVFYGKNRPEGVEDLSDLREEFERKGLDPESVGLNADYTCLAVYMCTHLTADLKQDGVSACVVTSHHELTVLSKTSIIVGHYHFTRISDVVVNDFEIVE